ncbi:ATP-binding protein [Candidatus Gracilibacteria bacterium]|nr:ATP-binding protein [Candidatus Gracilibacteria bacterium]
MNIAPSTNKRTKQVRDQKMKRHDLSMSLQSINRSFLDQNKDVKNWLKEFVHESLESMSLNDLEIIRMKLGQVAGIVMPSNISLVMSITDTLVCNMLIPDYIIRSEEKDIFKREISVCIQRSLAKIDAIILNQQKSPFTLHVGDTKNIEEEIDDMGSLDGKKIWIGNGFGFLIYGYNNKYKRFAFNIPIRIAVPSKINGEIKETDPKVIEKFLEEIFGKKGNSPKDKKWKGFSIFKNVHTDSEKIYGRIEKARYMILSITHEMVEDLSEDLMSHVDILDYIKKFAELNNFLIAEIAKLIGWNGKAKKSVLIQGTHYISAGYESDNEVNDEIKTKFGKLIVHIKEPVRLSDIGGQEKAKDEIRKIVALIQNKVTAELWGANMATGIIFYGPSGTGKTLLARALATSVGAEVYSIKMTDLANTAYINEGAKNVQDLFKYLRSQAKKDPDKKLILIFDELDALFKNRNNPFASPEDTKVVNTFLTEMDGFETLKNVIIVGTTNRLESIDNAIKRPGRLGTHIKVDLPESQDRAQIFRIHLEAAVKKAKRKNLYELSDEDYTNLGDISEGFSGAEVSEVIRISLEQKFFDQVTTNIEPNSIVYTDLLIGIEKLRNQNGNKNHIFRDMSHSELTGLIQSDKTGNITHALNMFISQKILEQLSDKYSSGAVVLPEMIQALLTKTNPGIGFVDNSK